MQKEITTAHDLLDADGNLIEAGWMRQPILRYNRDAIHHKEKRIQEWHYYFCGDEKYGFNFLIVSIGDIHGLACTFMDFKKNRQVDKTAICPQAESVLSMPATSCEDIHFKSTQAEGEYLFAKETVNIKVHFKQFSGADDLNVDLQLKRPKGDSIAHAFPFDGEKGLFFYCHKAPCMGVSGTITLGDFSYSFNPLESFSAMDWGRGVWPLYNTPYWGGACAMINGKEFGFNIGYKYGNVNAATENVIFYDGKAHKLEDVIFNISENETAWDKTWTFTSSDRRFEMKMEPVFVRYSNGSSGPQHQVFGYYYGTAVLDTGEKLSVNKLFGFAEKNIYQWAE